MDARYVPEAGYGNLSHGGNVITGEAETSLLHPPPCYLPLSDRGGTQSRPGSRHLARAYTTPPGSSVRDSPRDHNRHYLILTHHRPMKPSTTRASSSKSSGFGM